MRGGAALLKLVEADMAQLIPRRLITEKAFRLARGLLMVDAPAKEICS